MSCLPTYKRKRYNSIESLYKAYGIDKVKAQQLYSQYLDTIFPDSKVKDIVYHVLGSKQDIEGFVKFLNNTTVIDQTNLIPSRVTITKRDVTIKLSNQILKKLGKATKVYISANNLLEGRVEKEGLEKGYNHVLEAELINDLKFNGYKVLLPVDRGDHYRFVLDHAALTQWINNISMNQMIERVSEDALLDDNDAQVLKDVKNYERDNPTPTTIKQSRVHKIQKELESQEGVSGMLDVMIDRAKNPRMKQVMQAFKDKIVKQGLKIRFGVLNKLKYGQYKVDGQVIVDLYRVMMDKPEITDDKVDEIIFHELVHGITALNYITDQGFRDKITSIISKHFTIDEKGAIQVSDDTLKVMGDVFAKYGQTVKTKEDIYGLKNPFEFMSEFFSNPAFAEAINEVYHSPKQKTLLQEIWEAILSFFGFEKDMSTKIEKELTRLVMEAKYVNNFKRTGENTYEDSEGKVYTYSGNEFNLEATTIENETEQETDEARKKVLERAEHIRSETAKVSVEMKDDGTEGNSYIINGIGKRLKRITDMLNIFSNRKVDPDVSFAKYMADKRWEGKERTSQIENEKGVMEDYQGYYDRIDASMKNGALKGKIMHLLLKMAANDIFKLGFNNDQIASEINDLASLSGGVIDASYFEWVRKPENIQKIFIHAGINVFRNIPKSLKDITYLPEQTIWDEKIGWGGTADAMIAKADGTWSIKDYKTGNNFGIAMTNQLMKYGMQSIHIMDNQRERAKLQIMMYAFLFKLKYPDMKFTDLMTVWIPNEFMIDREDVDRHVEVGPYLNMLKSFFSDKAALKEAGIDPDIMENYILKKSPDIFSVSEYTNRTEESIYQELGDSPYNPESVYQQKVMEIQSILNQTRAGQDTPRQVRLDELSSNDKKRLHDLYKQVSMLRSDPSMQLDVYNQQDIGWLTEWIGNYSDIDIGVFQSWVNIRNQQWNKYTQQHERDLIHMERLLKPIYESYMKGRGRITRGGIDRIADVNYAELFKFAYKEEEHKGYVRERLKVKTDPEWKDLTKEQQDYLQYLNNMYMSWFVGKDAYLNQIAYQRGTTKVTWMELYNEGRAVNERMEYYPGWFPKIMKTMEEVRYEEGSKILRGEIGRGDIFGANVVGAFSKKVIKERMVRSLTYFVKDTWEGWSDTKMSIPIKYLDNYVVLNNKNYSRNLAFGFDGFNKSMLHKSHMDEVFVTGQALKTYLQLKKYGNGQPMFDNTIAFLEKKLIGDIQNRTVRQKITRVPLVLGSYYDPFKGETRDFNVDLDRVFASLGNWTSMITMWLKPMQGGGNGLHARSVTWREAIKGSIASTFLHIDGDAIDFTVKDSVFADGVYFGSFLKDSMVGDLRKNKAWLLSRKLNYMPDNYDYATNKRFLLSTRNGAIDSSSLYMTHSVPEEYVSLTTMIAQLHYLKNPKTGKSMWDSYQVKQLEDGSYDVEWVGGVRGYEKMGSGATAQYNKITDLTSSEIAKLKKVHERMQGGYRKEEASNLELYVLGRMFIQFKKYFPRLLMNALGSKKEVKDLGYYRKMYDTRKDPDTGEALPTYEWVARINEGRWRTLINVLAAYTTSRNKGYRWETLETEQKQNIVDAFLTLGFWMLSYGAYLAMFSDEPDDDVYKKWWKYYLIENTTQQYNIKDMLHTIESIGKPASVVRMYKLVDSTQAMLFAMGNLAIGEDKDASFTRDGDLKGWNEIMRSIPYVASYHDFAQKMAKGSLTEEWWGDRFEGTWR